MSESPPPQIPGVVLKEFLGGGGAARVYAGTLVSNGQAVAVKVVRRDGSPGAQLVGRAFQEARLCWSLNHPHVVRVYFWDTLPDGSAYLIMERLRGQTLSGRIRCAQLRSDQALAITRPIVAGLTAIHARGAVHRDVKPDNVFLCENGLLPDHVKLLDLGIAALRERDPMRVVHTQAGVVFGTPGFLPPEQARGEPVDARTDVYAVGATLHCMLANGTPPFFDPDPIVCMRRAAFATAPPPPLPAIPPAVQALLDRCLAPDRADRYADADTLLAAVDEARGASPRTWVATTVLLDGQPVEVNDIRVPTLGDLADHRRFRAHVARAVGTIYRPGHMPETIRMLIAEIDRLHRDKTSGEVERRRARAQAGALARDLATREHRLDEAVDRVDGELEAMVEGYSKKQGELMELANHIGECDRRYVVTYRRVEDLQRSAMERAIARNEPIALDSLYGKAILLEIGRLEDLYRRRQEASKLQDLLRDDMRQQHLRIADLRGQKCELMRSRLGLRVERETRLVELEDAARGAEDAELRLDREIEHAFLRLGAALQRDSIGAGG